MKKQSKAMQNLLTNLAKRRDAAIENGDEWPMTVKELLAAYEANMRDFRRANLSRAILDGANLSRATLSGANLSGATLSGATLSGATLYSATLSGANLDGANLSGANLSGATLSGANLSGANLSRAILDGATLSDATLSGATLSGATLSRANLSRATLPEGYHILQIGPVGSRRAYTNAIVYPDGQQIVQTGCFVGSLYEFIAEVARKPEGNEHRMDYEALVIPALRYFFAKWAKPAVEIVTELHDFDALLT